MGENREPTVAESLWAKAIGQEVLKFVRDRDEEIDRGVHSEALALLEQIKAILDNDTLDDPECFQRIDAMVDAFHEAGISTFRHDW